MAVSLSLDVLEDVIREKIEEKRWTHSQLSEFLLSNYPLARGVSVRSIRRFCTLRNIHKTSRPSTNDLNQAVLNAISEVSAVMGQHSYL